MNCNAAQPIISPAESGFSGTVLNTAFMKIQSLWQDHVCRSYQARASAVFADIDTHTLRDIGAPNWVVAEASLRSDSRGLRLIDLYRS